MRIQGTALLELDEKIALDDRAAYHKKTLSTVLRAGLLSFSALPADEQVVWIAAAEKNRENPKD